MAGILPRFLRVSPVNGEVVSGSINGTNTTFTLANTPLTSQFSFILALDGVIIEEYSLSGTTITMSSAPKGGQILKAYYTKAT